MRKCTAFLVALLLFPTLASAESPVGFLPFGKSMADGRELPLPLGATLTYYYQRQDYDLEKLTLRNLPIQVATTGIAVENRLDEVNLQIDAWLLPWLDVFGILGKLQATTTVDGVALMGQDIAVPDYDYNGLVYGGGATLAGGLGNWFGSLTGIYTNTNLSGDASSVKSWVVTPKVGYSFSRVRFWAGAMYQKAEEKHTGTFTMMLPTNLANPNPAEVASQTVSYEVEMHEKNPWNFLLGAETGFGPHWRLSVEGGMGGHRSQVQISLTARI
jgi:hypothetical protein